MHSFMITFIGNKIILGHCEKCSTTETETNESNNNKEEEMKGNLSKPKMTSDVCSVSVLFRIL